jgi:hypothetical protein
LLRDKDTTPEPGAGRFIPKDGQLADAFEALRNGATQGVPIDGVLLFLLDEDRIEISPDQPAPDLGDPSPEALRAIEGYGPSGNWRLELDNIDLRQVTDVFLKITYVIPESDGDLARRVKGLIAAYEQELAGDGQLDLITPFSLKQKFLDDFDRLAGGETTVVLERDDFPRGIDDLKLKTVLVQALDARKKGVAGVQLECLRPGTKLDLVRSTQADGFSEDVTKPIPFLAPDDRFPVEGSYTFRLPDPGQFGKFDDLLVFLVYEFKESER